MKLPGSYQEVLLLVILRRGLGVDELGLELAQVLEVYAHVRRQNSRDHRLTQLRHRGAGQILEDVELGGLRSPRRWM